MVYYTLLLCVLFGLTTGFTSWNFRDTLTTSTAVLQPLVFPTCNESTIFHIKYSCNAEEATFLHYQIYNPGTQQMEIFANVACDGQDEFAFSRPKILSGEYELQISGNPNTEYIIEIVLSQIKIELSEGTGTSEVVIEKEQMTVQSFEITEEDIFSNEYAYIQVRVDSTDKFLYPDSDDKTRYVAKLMVTQNAEDLKTFFSNPGTAISGSMRLSFSTFGLITLSDASDPALNTGTWLVGLTIMNTLKPNVTYDKSVSVTINIVTDYSYKGRIGILMAVSTLGVLIPLLERLIFDAANLTFDGFKWKCWFITLKNWFWSGKKGLTYLTALLAVLLIVSAFQVVHAKYDDMFSTGDRDICFYNEKCYRPYGSYYDVSVNGISSNIPFMVHGVILVVYFSFAEAYCRSNNHKYFDYSIPYSFGLSFICEGFGSLLYHICPSQIIFQFDTLFMFVITIIMIIGIFEGHSIRENDIRYSHIAKHKAIRTPKVFAFFVGPVYFFNFIGNLIATQGLPLPFIIVFYIMFGLWWVFILAWAAYKLDILPDAWDPHNGLDIEEAENVVETFASKNRAFLAVSPYTKTIKTVCFAAYCALVLVCFVGALTGKLAFSIFILGILVVAVIILTLVFFIPLMWTVVKFFYLIPMNIAASQFTCTVSKHFFIIFGVFVYVIIGCAVTVISLLFFTYFSVTDKSIDPWESRELNNDCYLNGFYDTHDFWHLFASFALMMMAMLNVQISKPCRDCYLAYLQRNRIHIRTLTMRCSGRSESEAPDYVNGKVVVSKNLAANRVGPDIKDDSNLKTPESNLTTPEMTSADEFTGV